MSRLSLFNSPLLLGFEQFEQAIDRVSKTADGYPPYDVEQISENCLRITLALAGFSEEDLQVRIEDNQLVVRGKQQDDDETRTYLHRGIAARQFQRSFVLAEGIEVTAATLHKGLLHIDMERPNIEPQVRSIKINSGGRKAAVKTIEHGGKGSE